MHLLDAARRAALRPAVLVVGSAEEYGPVREAELPIRETAPLRPASPYAVSKVAQGALALLYGPAGGMRVVLTRTFHHTGPGRGEAFAESSFARQIAEIERGLRPPVIEVGNLDAVRDFTDVRDVVRAYRLLLEQGRAGPGLQRVQRPRPQHPRACSTCCSRRSTRQGRGARRPGAPASLGRAGAGRATRRACARRPAGSRASRSSRRSRDLLADWSARVAGAAGREP